MIFNQFGFGLTYHVFEGDHSHLHGIYINGEKNWDELNSLIYGNSEGEPEMLNEVSSQELAKAIVKGAKLIECGFHL